MSGPQGGPREGVASWQNLAKLMSGASSAGSVSASSIKSEAISSAGGGGGNGSVGGSNKKTLEAQLRVCSKPVIGLNHIVEYIYPEEEGAIYSCKLCAVFRTAATILDHICSHHHRVRTLWKAFPADSNMFLLPNKKLINRSPGLVTVATKRSQDYEVVYGRGDMVVRHERPSFNEADLDADESDELEIIDTAQLKYLETTLKELKTLKVRTGEEARLVDKICELLTDQICVFKCQVQE